MQVTSDVKCDVAVCRLPVMLSVMLLCAGYQPPVELLRNMLSSGCVYDHQRQVFQEMQEASFIAASTLPTAPGRNGSPAGPSVFPVDVTTVYSPSAAYHSVAEHWLDFCLLSVLVLVHGLISMRAG